MTALTYDEFAANQRLESLERGLILFVLESVLPADLLDEGRSMLDRGTLGGGEGLSEEQRRVVQLSESAVGTVREIVARITKWVSDTFAAARARVARAVENQRAHIVDLVRKSNKKLIVEEVSHLRKITASMVEWMRAGLAREVSAGSARLATAEEGVGAAIAAALVSEGAALEVPFASAVARRLYKVPPFNILHRVGDGAEAVAAGALNRFSYYATKLADAPGPYEFVALSAVIGALAEVGVKAVAQDALVAAIPGIGTLVAVIAGVALGLAVVGVVETALRDVD